MKQGDIYLVQWDPSVGHEFQKARPGIVISSDLPLKESSLVTFVAITHTLKTPVSDDIFIPKDAVNRLNGDSMIKVHHISSFDRARIIKYIGEVSEDILDKIKAYLSKHFDL